MFCGNYAIEGTDFNAGVCGDGVQVTALDAVILTSSSYSCCIEVVSCNYIRDFKGCFGRMAPVLYF
jgi:hypothetical protein